VRHHGSWSCDKRLPQLTRRSKAGVSMKPLKNGVYGLAITAALIMSPPSNADVLDNLLDDGFNTADVIEQTLACTDCLNYRITGVCTWLKCSLTGCSVETSILVDHFLPDFVVAAYSNKSPWEDLDGITKRNQGNVRTELDDVQPEANRIDTNLDFKHADVITNPAILIYNELASQSGFSCESVETVPAFPHFVSKLDPAWHIPIVEQFYPQAILGQPRMSRLPDYWGPIYPRSGWTSLPFDAMSALVTAHRASLIVTGDPSLHVYIPAGDDCSRNSRCWPPVAVELDDRDNNRYQLLYPEPETQSDSL